MSKFIGILSSSVVGAGLLAGLAQAEEINIATVNNGDMIIMQKLSSAREKETGNKINWIVLEENVLRERVTTDIATNGGQFDIMTIGGYEAPIWGKQGWLAPVDDLGDDYDYADLLDPIKRPDGGRQALCRAVLYQLVHPLPQGPVRRGRPENAR